MEDATTIANILSGDRRTLHTFYYSYTPKLDRYIRTKVNNPKDAEEILQDTLYAFLEAVRDFAGKSTIQTFLFAIANHKIVDYYRRKKIKHVVFSRLPQLETLVAPFFSPEDTFDATLVKENVHRILARLLPNHRRVLILKYLDQLTVAEIAQKLSISLKSVESQLFRARKAFVQLFLSI